MAAVLFHRLRVAEVVRETADATSLIFELAPHQRAHFDYRPGQFLTLRIPSDRGAVARCYSLSSSPDVDERLKVTVKRVEGGYASHWICDNARPGTEIDVLEPAGVFTPASRDEDLLLVAGGSGITPIMSITKSVLATGTGKITVLYANRDRDSVIFAAELDRLVAEHPHRMVVRHWLETERGLPTTDGLAEEFGSITFSHAFVCGPKPFMDAVRKTLRDMDIPRSSVRLERFASLGGNPFDRAVAAETRDASNRVTKVEVDIEGGSHTFDWPADTRLLSLLESKGLDVPSSCGEGVCASCECRVVEGEVRMVNNQVLEDEDLAEGYVLACQALPVTDLVKVIYG
jgi:3-ketosteroid 9alpha-monooxygenase subunit B